MTPAPPEKDIAFYLFHRSIEASQVMDKAGISALIVDFETNGKHKRQEHFDTEINAHTLDDLRGLRTRVACPILCRVNGPAPRQSEIDTLVDAGTDEIIIPMIRSATQVERVLDMVRGRMRIMAMIETQDAVDCAEDLCALPIQSVYVGLNDLHISRGTQSIFEPMIDGLLPRLHTVCRGKRFGFGGLTLPGCGAPLATEHLYAEMARMECSFTFLRRSFYRDLAGNDPRAALDRMRTAMRDLRQRAPDIVEQDHRRMTDAVRRLIRPVHVEQR